MLNARRALMRNANAGRLLPRVEAFHDLYTAGVEPRHGQVIMVAGRSGSQKSGLAMFWTDEMNLPTLYFSADMSPFTASARLASKRTGFTVDQVERAMRAGDVQREHLLEQTGQSNISFSFANPISWKAIDQELQAYAELWNRYPEVVVFDNLMDFEGASNGYEPQMETMQGITEFSRDTKATSIVMHHASDKSWDAKQNPWAPPGRDQIKGGMSEKPEITLSVALDPRTMHLNVATVKNRMGPSDPPAATWVSLRCEPEVTRFHRL